MKHSMSITRIPINQQAKWNRTRVLVLNIAQISVITLTKLKGVGLGPRAYRAKENYRN